MTKKKEDKGHGKMALGAGIAAAAAAGAYFLFGTKKGKETRLKMKGWMIKAKGEVLDKMEDVKEITEERYNKIVDTTVDKYKKLKKVQEKEAEMLRNDLRKHWKNIKSEMTKDTKKSK